MTEDWQNRVSTAKYRGVYIKEGRKGRDGIYSLMDHDTVCQRRGENQTPCQASQIWEFHTGKMIPLIFGFENHKGLSVGPDTCNFKN